MNRARVRVGTSGYSFEDWRGVFYPEKIEKGKMLDFYVQHFDTVEINSTYYGIPAPRVFENMVKKTDERFTFMVKAHQSLTHQRQSAVEETPKFLAAIQPVREAGKFGGVVAQFPWSFPNTEQHRQHLAKCRELLADLPLFAEFRHASWISTEIFAWLKTLGIGFVSVDEPQLEKMVPPVAVATAPTAYVRLHGRNAAKWYSGNGSERYDYCYRDDELRDWIRKIEQLRGETREVFLFFNNCHEGQAITNARRIMEMMDVRGI